MFPPPDFRLQGRQEGGSQPMLTTPPFRFDDKKAVEIILYIATRVPEPDRLHINKIVYTADRYHLASYGRFTCGDKYRSMDKGAVPSGIYDFLKGNRDTVDRSFTREGNRIKPERDANTDLLSESDIECLDRAIRELGSLETQELIEVCHDQAWHATGRNKMISVEEIAKTLPNGAEIIGYLHSL
jgi:hypothetical protein